MAFGKKKKDGLIKDTMTEINSNIVLKTTDLCIGYASKNEYHEVSKNINVCLKKGQLISLVGRNGIGKSTLLRTLSKMQPRLNGDILLNKKAIDSLSRNDLAKIISLVLTEKIPASNLSVYELIALGRQPYTNWLGKLLKEDIKYIDEAIAQSHLSELAYQRCDKLSDGQLQRVMICRALAQDTGLIILDEPTAHLDVQHKMETFRLLKKIAHELNKSILISTHEIQLATQMSDELWIMTENEIISGNPAELIATDKINLIFDSSSIIFDKESRQFIMK